MDRLPPAPFRCPHCGTDYKLVRARAEEIGKDRGVTCLSCDGPLTAREGAFVMKYFLVDKPAPRQNRAH
jgi:hypothetical protein